MNVGDAGPKRILDGAASAATDSAATMTTVSDGAMLAYKTLMLRSALTETLCAPAGASGGPGGGPPMRGFPGDGAPPPMGGPRRDGGLPPES